MTLALFQLQYLIVQNISLIFIRFSIENGSEKQHGHAFIFQSKKYSQDRIRAQ